MENKTNRFFYNGVTETDYKKTSGNYVKFITRFEEKNHEKLKKLFGKNFNFTKKPTDFDRDKTAFFRWDILPYNNSTARDMISCITIIVCKPEDVEKVTGILTGAFNDVCIRKANPNSRTVTIDLPVNKRGIYKTRYQPEIQYPIAIVSFSRYTNETGLTHLFLKKCGIAHKIFVEPQEYKNYSAWTSEEYLVCGKDFSKENMGSTPMRNFILDYYKNHKRVWILDDNIIGYQRLNGGIKNFIESSIIFSSVEQYIKQYDNIGAVSHNFSPFIREGDCRAVLVENGKSFSSMCLLTDGPRFKHRYQEDHFISIEYLTRGFRNLCFNHIMYSKHVSGSMGGGNMVSLYNKDGYTQKAEYMFNTLKSMIEQGELKLKKNCVVTDLCRKDVTMKSKALHYRIDYKVLDINPISKHTPETIYEKWNSDFIYLDNGEKERPRWYVGKTLTSEDVEYLLANCV